MKVTNGFLSSVWLILHWYLYSTKAIQQNCTILAGIKKDTQHRQNSKLIFNNFELKFSNTDDFVLTKLCGSGFYGDVYFGNHVFSLESFVFKIFRFQLSSEQQMIQEILALQTICSHPNLVTLRHIIKQSLTNYPVLVFELIEGTSNSELVQKLTVEDMRYFMYEAMKGLAFAHSRGIIHNDIKLSNILFDYKNRIVKIIDFGLSQFYVKGKKKSEHWGDLFYRPPDALMENAYADMSVDMWALGCVFAELIYNKTVFFEGERGNHVAQLKTIAQVLGTSELTAYAEKFKSTFELSKLVRKFSPSPRQSWQSLVTTERASYASEEALHLLSHMLVYDHTKRITAKDALEHRYFHSLHHYHHSATYKKLHPTAQQHIH